MKGNNKFYLIAAGCIVVAIIYFFVPIDFIPDLIVLVGWLDDLLVGILGLVGLTINILWATGVIPAPENNSDNTNATYGTYQEM